MHNYARLELDSTKSTIVKTSTEIYAHIILEQFHETDLIRLKKDPGYTRKAFEALQPFSGLDPDSTYQHAINKTTSTTTRSDPHGRASRSRLRRSNFATSPGPVLIHV